MESILGTVTIGSIVADGSTVAAQVAPYVGIALAFVFGPRLLKWGIGLIKSR